MSSSHFSRWFQVQASDFLLDDSALAESAGNIESSDKTGQYGANISTILYDYKLSKLNCLGIGSHLPIITIDLLISL